MAAHGDCPARSLGREPRPHAGALPNANLACLPDRSRPDSTTQAKAKAHEAVRPKKIITLVRPATCQRPPAALSGAPLSGDPCIIFVLDGPAPSMADRPGAIRGIVKIGDGASGRCSRDGVPRAPLVDYDPAPAPRAYRPAAMASRRRPVPCSQSSSRRAPGQYVRRCHGGAAGRVEPSGGVGFFWWPPGPHGPAVLGPVAEALVGPHRLNDGRRMGGGSNGDLWRAAKADAGERVRVPPPSDGRNASDVRAATAPSRARGCRSSDPRGPPPEEAAMTMARRR